MARIEIIAGKIETTEAKTGITEVLTVFTKETQGGPKIRTTERIEIMNQ